MARESEATHGYAASGTLVDAVTPSAGFSAKAEEMVKERRIEVRVRDFMWV